MKNQQDKAFKRVLVLVFDGLSPKKTKEWSDSGQLPSFNRLMKEGAFGVLRSTIPPVTAPASAAVMTGVQPGKSGIYDLYEIDREKLSRTRLNYLGKSRVPTIIDVANMLGISVGVFGIPLLYPVPKPINGFAVAGFGVPSNTRFAEPESIFRRLKKEGYLPGGIIIDLSDPEILKKLISWMKKEWELFKSLWMEYKPEISIYWITGSDHASHYFWVDQEKLLKVYKTADEILQDALTLVSQDTLLIIMSDHGFSSIKNSFFPNALLWKHGYLAFRRSLITPIKLIATRFVRWARKVFPTIDAAAALGIATRESLVKKFVRSFILSYRDLDYKKTKALAIGSPTEFSFIFLRNDLKEGVKDKEKRCIQDLKEIFSNINVVEEVLEGNVVYKGTALEEAPDLIVKLKDDVVSMTSNIPHSKTSVGGPPWSQFRGKHQRNGIIGILGPGVKKGAKLVSDICDILPTILHALGYPIPDYVDGKPIIDAFIEESPMKGGIRFFSPVKLRTRYVVKSIKRKLSYRK